MDLAIEFGGVGVDLGVAAPASITLSVASVGTDQDASLKLSFDLDLAVRPKLQIGVKQSHYHPR